MLKKKKKPHFQRSNFGRKNATAIKDRWRSPRGRDNKQKLGIKYAGKKPAVGYGNAKEVRGMHPCGLREVLVHNEAELEKAGNRLVRIARTVGKRKSAAIRKKAASLKLRTAN